VLLEGNAGRADGAFPDSSQLYAPAGSSRLLLTTNFGLVVSEDDGQHWSWVCEEAVGRNAFLYAPAAPPSVLVWAVDRDGRLVRSPDAGRSWTAVASDVLGAGRQVTDVFADPNDGARALAAFVGPGGESGILESRDAGATFELLHRAPAGWRVESLEISPLDGRLLTAVLLSVSATDPASELIRSDDGGWTWRSLPLTPSVGRRQVRIAALDRRRPDTAWLRVLDAQPGSDTLAVVEGDVVTTVQATSGPMSTFLQFEDASYAVAALGGGAWRSSDGRRFVAWDGVPRLRGLAEREGVLFAAADPFRDGFAVARSRDRGTTWEPVLRWPELCGIHPSPLLEVVCAEPWRTTIVERWGHTPPDGCPPLATPPRAPAPERPGGGFGEAGCNCRTSGVPAWLMLLTPLRKRGKGRRADRCSACLSGAQAQRSPAPSLPLLGHPREMSPEGAHDHEEKQPGRQPLVQPGKQVEERHGRNPSSHCPASRR
jgi:hypothetical protein